MGESSRKATSHRGPGPRRSSGLGGLLALALLAPRLVAAETWEDKEHRKRCATAYERAQEHRLAGDYLLARDQLLLCHEPRCPEFISQACTGWLGEVNATVATVVFEVRRGDESLTRVAVLRDGVRLLERIDGDPLELDPGPHQFVLMIPGEPPLVRDLTLLPAEKNRTVRVLLPERLATSRPSETRSNGTGALPWLFGGVGVLGLSGFALLGVYGSERESELRESCAPNCRAAELAEVRRTYLFADISLGVGLLGLGTAATLYFTSDSSQTARAGSLRLGVTPLGTGLASVCEGSF